MPVGTDWPQQPRPTGKPTRWLTRPFAEVTVDLIARTFERPVWVGLDE